MAHATINVTVCGATYPTSHELKQAVVTVSAAIGTKSASLGNNSPSIIARMLLRELIEVGRLRRDGII